MNFQNTNSLNVRLNLLSGNLLPMINRDSSFPFFWKMHSVFVWIIHFILIIAIISGCIYVPIEKALDGMLAIVIFTEILFAVLRIFIRKNLAYKLIQKLNEILHIADEVMNNVVIATFKPIKIPINFYLSSGLVSIIVWSCIHFVLIFEKNLFYYEDYRMPAAFSEQPFSFRIFLLGDLFILIVLVYMYIKKVSVEITSTTFGEAISIVVYTSGATVQLYILCSCVQQLLDAFIFFYVNYNLPATFNSEPFSSSAMISSTTLKIVGTIYLFLKKFGMDVYMMHLVLMLTAQYRYTATKLAILFRDPQIYNESRKEHYPMENRQTERELRKLCLQQNIVLKYV
ncbi:hypothetical protein ALC57_11487 [Trachymyrmex cornetzi]|uniref:Odorant receptor n=1 Tax=Trachymyrmex cornetzi TaxID=471704 RepID=A0A195DTT8_9HYME|nr:hypothetical protein ALC57_11487 [Trachymyrmex cornetzi]